MDDSDSATLSWPVLIELARTSTANVNAEQRLLDAAQEAAANPPWTAEDWAQVIEYDEPSPQTQEQRQLSREITQETLDARTKTVELRRNVAIAIHNATIRPFVSMTEKSPGNGIDSSCLIATQNGPLDESAVDKFIVRFEARFGGKIGDVMIAEQTLRWLKNFEDTFAQWHIREFGIRPIVDRSTRPGGPDHPLHSQYLEWYKAHRDMHDADLRERRRLVEHIAKLIRLSSEAVMEAAIDAGVKYNAFRQLTEKLSAQPAPPNLDGVNLPDAKGEVDELMRKLARADLVDGQQGRRVQVKKGGAKPGAGRPQKYPKSDDRLLQQWKQAKETGTTKKEFLTSKQIPNQEGHRRLKAAQQRLAQNTPSS